MDVESTTSHGRSHEDTVLCPDCGCLAGDCSGSGRSRHADRRGAGSVERCRSRRYGHSHTPQHWKSSRGAITSVEGAYLVVNLPPGEVIVEAEAPGFQRFVRTVLLEIGNRVSLDLTLPVGAVTETVQVQGVTPLLDTQSPVVGSVVSQTEVAKSASGDPQLGRSSLHGSRCPGRSLHGADWHHQRRPDGRSEHSRQPLSPEQLPARRRRQQLHLDQRARAQHAGVAPVDRLDWRVQGGDQPVHGRVRARSRWRDRRHHQVRDESVPRDGLRLLPQRRVRFHLVFRGARESGEGGQRSEPVRRQHRRAHYSRTGPSSSSMSRPRESRKGCFGRGAS